MTFAVLTKDGVILKTFKSEAAADAHLKTIQGKKGPLRVVEFV